MAAEAPPSADGYPVVGIAPQYLRNPVEQLDAVAARGDVVTYRLLHRTFTGVYHPDPVETVLMEEASKFRKGGIGRSDMTFIQNGLFLAEGDQWKRQRELLQPMFFLDRVRSYGDAMLDHARDMVDSWDDGEVIELRSELSQLTLRILAETVLGVDMRDEREATITRIADTIVEVASPTKAAMYLPPWVPSLSMRRFQNVVSEFETLVDELLAKRRENPGESDDLLGLLAEAEYDDGTPMDDVTIRDQLMTFLLAGRETSSLGLTFTMYLLAQHDEERQRVRREVEDLGGPVRTSDVPDLDRVELALKESLRRRPPAHVLFREPKEPVTLGGYRIEADRTLTLSPLHIHNDERWYDDPDEYRPDRWTGGLEEDLHEFAYLPFGAGPRQCIGRRFAMLEMQLVLATVLRQVDFELVTDPDDVGLVPASTLRPDREVEVRIRR